jgi:hypothetical protein
MSFLMNICFPLHPLHPPNHTPLLLFHLLFCLFNLKMLHTRLFCCLIMVQVLEEVLVLSCWTVHAVLLLLLLMQPATSIAAWLMQSLRSTCAVYIVPMGRFVITGLVGAGLLHAAPSWAVVRCRAIAPGFSCTGYRWAVAPGVTFARAVFVTVVCTSIR